MGAQISNNSQQPVWWVSEVTGGNRYHHQHIWNQITFWNIFAKIASEYWEYVDRPTVGAFRLQVPNFTDNRLIWIHRTKWPTNRSDTIRTVSSAHNSYCLISNLDKINKVWIWTRLSDNGIMQWSASYRTSLIFACLSYLVISVQRVWQKWS